MSTDQQMMRKGCEVEVCLQEEGLEGVWLRAVLEENPTQTGCKKLRVRYTKLLQEDSSTPLNEAIEQRFIRPVPPEEEYIGVVLEEGMVVDAHYRDGWWTCVVINNKLEDDNFLVYFDSPPDIIKYQKNKLRARLDWTGSKWELDKSMFGPGTMVEVSSFIGKEEVAWFPAMFIKEIEVDGDKKFIVKDCSQDLSCYGEDAKPNTTVDPRRVRSTPPSFSAEDYHLLACVEAFHGSVWRRGSVRGILSGKHYKVTLEATKEEHVFGHSHVRPFKVWEDEAWHDGPKISCDEDYFRFLSNVMLNPRDATYVEETPMALTFAKKSPYWKRCESTEGYKSVPQRPHFSPLLEAREDIRDWSAVGMIVTFYGLLEEVKDLRPDDSLSIFSSLNVSFIELEKHGFDIAAPRSRIDKMLYIKDERAKKAEEKQCFENKIGEVEKESRKLKEERNELKRKALELQRREAVAKEEKEAADKRIVDMKSSVGRIVHEIEDAELEFLKTASAPW